MLVYNAEIWPEYKVAHTKSDWTGFKITSDITVPIVWQYWLQLAPNSLLWGCIKIYSYSTRIFLKKYITGSKYMYWKCRYRGGDHMTHQSKTPLKLHQSGSDFHRKLSSYQTLILYWLDLLRKPIKNFNFPGFGARLSPPQIRKYQVYPNTTNLKLFFNFAYVLTIIEDILGPFGALHLWK